MCSKYAGRWSKIDDGNPYILPSIRPCSPRMRRSPLPRRWNWTNGWLVCAQISARLLDLDCPVPLDASGGRFCGGGSEQKDVSTVVGGHPRQLSCWSLRNVFLGSLSGSDPAGTAHRRRMRKQGKRLMWSGGIPRLSQRLARFVRMTLSFSRVRAHARGLPSALSPSLPSGPGYPSQMSHYRKEIWCMIDTGSPARCLGLASLSHLPL